MHGILRLGLLGLCLSLLVGCAGAQAGSRHSQEALAGRVPVEATDIFFLDLKPEGQVGRDWQRFLTRLEQLPEGRSVLDAMLARFEVMAYPILDLVSGSGASGTWNRVHYAILRIDDAEAVQQAMHAPEVGATWTEEEYGGRLLYDGAGTDRGGRPRFVSWTATEGLLYLVSSTHNSPLPQLKSLLDLPADESLAALPAWRTLADRLPDEAVALYFTRPPRQSAPPPAGASRRDLLAAHLQALSLAVVPDEGGIRIQIEGTLTDDAGDVPEIRALYDLTALDPDWWPGLLADTAVAIMGHDAPTTWPWAYSALDLDAGGLFGGLRQALALDFEADLLDPEGPLSGPFAFGLAPPLPDQAGGPLPAGQFLILAPEAGARGAARLRAAMEGRGATFDRVEVDGVELQRGMGATAGGYALTYALDAGVLTIGSSPTVVARSVLNTRRQEGLVQEEAFLRACSATLRDPAVLVYVSVPRLTELAEANAAAGLLGAKEMGLLGVFESIAAGIRLNHSEIQGAIYLSLAGE